MEQLVNHHKIVQDAEIMTLGEFIQEHGQQYLDYYEQVQSNLCYKEDEYEASTWVTQLFIVCYAC